MTERIALANRRGHEAFDFVSAGLAGRLLREIEARMPEAFGASGVGP